MRGAGLNAAPASSFGTGATAELLKQNRTRPYLRLMKLTEIKINTKAPRTWLLFLLEGGALERSLEQTPRTTSRPHPSRFKDCEGNERSAGTTVGAPEDLQGMDCTFITADNVVSEFKDDGRGKEAADDELAAGVGDAGSLGAGRCRDPLHKQ